MKYRPSRAFVWCLMPLLFTGAAGAWAWKKASAAPLHVRAKSGFLELLRYKEKQPLIPMTPEKAARLRKDALELKERMLVEFPALRIEPRPVPDERNGFLALHRLAGENHQGPVVEKEFADRIGGSISWDSAAVKAGLEAHSDVVEEYERIAAMEGRSSTNLPPDYVGFVSARAAKRGADLLLAKARLAAESGDEGEVLRLVGAAQNLASHFREVEASNLLCETAVILMDLGIQSAVFEHLLPALGDGSDLRRWEAVLFQRDYDAASFAELMRGEWNTMADFMVFPILVNPKDPGVPRDAERLVRAYSAVFHEIVSADSGLPGFPGASDLSARFPELSNESRELLETLCSGGREWAKGYVRAASITARNRAAIDLLIREKKEGNAGEPGADPVSGRPFVFDPTERTLSVPASTAGLEVEPLKLPW